MLLASLRDLQYRARRFSVTILGTALVFALTLLLAGVASSFDLEAERVVDSMDVDGWMVGADSQGPYLSATPLSEDLAEDLRELDGVDEASAMVFTRKTLGRGDPFDVNVIGIGRGGVGMPVADEGRSPEEEGEILISDEVPSSIGETLFLGGTEFAVVGTLDDSTGLAGVPNVFMGLVDAQAIGFASQPVVTSVAFRGNPQELPDEIIVVDRDDALDDLLRPIEDAQSGILLISILLWVVAASIVGSVVYLSAIERERDFAVFKAIGWSNRSLLGGLLLQTMVVVLLAAAFGALIAVLLTPRFPLAAEITTTAYLTLPIGAVLIGFAASAAGLRRIARIDPARAFG